MSANWVNRTMWTGDNLAVMRGMNSESADLIYLDPPFNSNRDYSAPIGSKAAGAAFKDTWTLDDVDLAWHGEIAEQNPAVYAVIDAAGVAHDAGQDPTKQGWIGPPRQLAAALRGLQQRERGP